MKFSTVLYYTWLSISISHACGSSEVILNSPSSQLQTLSSDCVACLDKDAVVCNLNCGHTTYCEECYWNVLLHSRIAQTTALYNGYIPFLCPVCRAAFTKVLKIQRPLDYTNYPCMTLNCRKTAEYFHKRCGNLILCSDCYQSKINTCPACNSNRGRLRKIYLPVDDYAAPMEFPEPAEMEYHIHEGEAVDHSY
ncbi:MAG: hypothetical protein O2897_00085 [bacterium]|nr:hypothetical protein [bacterium]